MAEKEPLVMDVYPLDDKRSLVDAREPGRQEKVPFFLLLLNNALTCAVLQPAKSSCVQSFLICVGLFLLAVGVILYSPLVCCSTIFESFFLQT